MINYNFNEWQFTFGGKYLYYVFYIFWFQPFFIVSLSVVLLGKYFNIFGFAIILLGLLSSIFSYMAVMFYKEYIQLKDVLSYCQEYQDCIFENMQEDMTSFFKERFKTIKYQEVLLPKEVSFEESSNPIKTSNLLKWKNISKFIERREYFVFRIVKGKNENINTKKIEVPDGLKVFPSMSNTSTYIFLRDPPENLTSTRLFKSLHEFCHLNLQATTFLNRKNVGLESIYFSLIFLIIISNFNFSVILISIISFFLLLYIERNIYPKDVKELHLYSEISADRFALNFLTRDEKEMVKKVNKFQKIHDTDLNLSEEGNRKRQEALDILFEESFQLSFNAFEKISFKPKIPKGLPIVFVIIIFNSYILKSDEVFVIFTQLSFIIIFLLLVWFIVRNKIQKTKDMIKQITS